MSPPLTWGWIFLRSPVPGGACTGHCLAAIINPLASLPDSQSSSVNHRNTLGATHPVTSNTMSQNHWVSFEERAVTSDLPLATASIQPQLSSSGVMMPRNPFHDAMSQGMSQVIEGSSSRYSAFDKIRQEELRGGDLGWSEEIMGTQAVTNEKAALWPSSQSEARTTGFRGSGA